MPDDLPASAPSPPPRLPLPPASPPPTDRPTSSALLECRLENVKSMTDALACVYSAAHKGQEVAITAHADGGLRFAVHHVGCLQASVIIPRSAFATFRNAHPALCIRLNLSLLIECLNLFGTSSATAPTTSHASAAAAAAEPTAACLWYAADGEPLCIRLWDGEADTLCRLRTLAGEHVADLDLAFYSYGVSCTTVLRSYVLRDALAELDYAGATTAELRVAPNAPSVVFSSPAPTLGDHPAADPTTTVAAAEPLCRIELPQPFDPVSDAFQSFECSRVQCAVYKLAHLRRCRNALIMADSCKLRLNAMGMLSIMCTMKTSDADRVRAVMAEPCYVEMVIVAQEIDDDDEEDNDENYNNDEDGRQPAGTPATPIRQRGHNTRHQGEDSDGGRGTPSGHHRGSMRRGAPIESLDLDLESDEDDDDVAGTPT